MINTYSKFYYGHKITKDNNLFPVDEGSGEVVVELRVGTYSLTEYIAELQRAFGQFLDNEYTINVDRDNRIITYESDAPFEFLFGSSDVSFQSGYDLAGFAQSDYSSSGDQIIAPFPSGKEYIPQTKLDRYKDFNFNRKAIQSVVNESANGIVEVIQFGSKQNMELNIKYINNESFSKGAWIKNDPSAIENAIDFLEYITGKGNLEFIPDEDDPSEFTICYLESTEQSKDGVDYELSEMAQDRLFNFYQTGLLTFRKV